MGRLCYGHKSRITYILLETLFHEFFLGKKIMSCLSRDVTSNFLLAISSGSPKRIPSSMAKAPAGWKWIIHNNVWPLKPVSQKRSSYKSSWTSFLFFLKETWLASPRAVIKIRRWKEAFLRYLTYISTPWLVLPKTCNAANIKKKKEQSFLPECLRVTIGHLIETLMILRILWGKRSPMQPWQWNQRLLCYLSLQIKFNCWERTSLHVEWHACWFRNSNSVYALK